MSGFESRVRDALTGKAGQAPEDVSGLADAARARRGRRRRAIGGAVLAAAVVAAVPLGLSLVDRDDSPSGGDQVVADPSHSAAPSASADPSEKASELPDGWRWESWRNIEVAVPGEWQDGSAYDLCIPGHPSPPPGNISRDGYQADFEPDERTQASCPQGLTFLVGDPAEPIAVGKGVGERLSIGGNTVDVVARDQKTLDTIVGSAHEITEADALGCAPKIVFGKADYGTADGAVVVCEYVVGGYGSDGVTPALDGSRTIKASLSQRIREIVGRSSGAKNDDAGDYGCPVRKGDPPYVVRRLLSDGVVLADISSATCNDVQLFTVAGPAPVDYELLDALDPATMSLN